MNVNGLLKDMESKDTQLSQHILYMQSPEITVYSEENSELQRIKRRIPMQVTNTTKNKRTRK